MLPREHCQTRVMTAVLDPSGAFGSDALQPDSRLDPDGVEDRLQVPHVLV